MEAPDRCECSCSCRSSSDYYDLLFLDSPERKKRRRLYKAQEELKRLSMLPKEVTKEEYEKNISEYGDQSDLKNIFAKLHNKEEEMTDKPMTVGDLREAIKEYPDDMEVFIWDAEYGEKASIRLVQRKDILLFQPE